MGRSERDIWWTQLKTLVWKNFTLWRRNKLFLLLELVWPLVLFGIIVLVRLQRPPVDKPSCHFQAKALPSAGFLPFLRTYLCTINNGCSNYPPEADNRLSKFEQLTLSYTGLLQDEDFRSSIQWFLDSNAQLLIQPGGLFNLDNNLPLSEDTKRALRGSRLNVAGYLFNNNVNGFQDLNANQFNDILMAPFQSFQLCEDGQLTDNVILTVASSRENVSKEVCSLTSNQQNRLIKPFNDVISYLFSVTGALRMFSLYTTVQNYDTISLTLDALNAIQELGQLTPTSGTNAASSVGISDSQANAFATLVQFTCGMSATMTGLLSLGTLESTAQSYGVEFGKNEYVYDDEYSPACNSLFETLESTVVSRNLWKYLKPIVVGKVFFSPNSEATTKIMTVMNETFQELDEMFEIVKLVNNSRSVIYQQVYNYFEDPENNDIPLLDAVIAVLPGFVDFNSRFNETAQQFFSNPDSNDDPSLVTWQNLFNSTFDVLEMITDYFDCVPMNRLEVFNSEEELIENGSSLIKRGKIWAGIVFTNFEPDSTDDEVPHHVKYKIRMNTDRVDSTRWVIDRVWFPDPRAQPIPDLKPFYSGQVFIMDLLEKAIIKVQSENSENFVETGTWLNQFPSPCYKEDKFLYAISRTIPLFMTLAWLFSVGMTVKGIVYEKETRLKEVMKIMGLSNSILWLSWFITTFILLLTASFVLSLILKFGTVLTNSNFLLIVFMFASFVLPTITFCFLISTFFSKANLASACAGIVFFCAYLPYTLYLTWEQYITSNVAKLSLCLSSNVAFGFACSYFAYFEQQGTGVQFDNINTSPNYQDNFSLSWVLFMMYFDAVIYLLLALYIEQCFPGAYGVPKKWYFIFQKSFWLSKTQNDNINSNYIFDPDFTVTGENYEAEPRGEKIGIQIRDLTKIYSTGKKLAVNKLSINFYQNQITSFLGHNGAGKTTTLSIITGLFNPTDGTAFVNGLDIRENMDEIRRSVGMCPQYNVLFDNLTVAEHLYFYGRLRGRDSMSIQRDCVKLLSDLNLPHKSDTLSKELSGGMKRKLSVAISFVGENKTVILDEPTAGVDPFSRRGIWELLSKYKEGRTIILSTHHMDEADVLGDRIAIIANGKLQCSGSSLFLRRHYGEGYLLTIAREPTLENATDGSQSGDIMKFVCNHFPEARKAKELGQEITFVLPYQGLDQGSFLTLFESLRTQGGSLGISDYGLSDTSLEEIFIKVADQVPDSMTEAEGLVPKSRFSFRLRKNVYIVADNTARKKDLETDGYQSEENKVVPTISDVVVMKSGTGGRNVHNNEAFVDFQQADRFEAKNFAEINVPKVQGTELLWLQFCALYIKRFHHLRKDSKAFLTQIVLPALFVLLAMFSSMVLPDPLKQKALELQPWIYGDNHWMFFSDSSRSNPQVKRTIEDYLISSPHHSTRCVTGYSIREHSCKPNVEDSRFSNPVSSWKLRSYDPNSDDPSPSCSCESGYPVCDAFAGGPEPGEKQLATTDRLQNLTARNLSDYLVKTRLDFRLQRFYGFEFKGAASDFNITQGDLFNAAQTLKELLDEYNLINGSYSNGLSWQAVINDLISLLNTTMAPNNVKVWWNNKAHHGMLSSVNAMHNVLLRSSLSDTLTAEEKSEYGISAFTHPWQLTQDQLTEAALQKSGRDLIIGICVIFAMSFIPASFILYLIDERVSKSKHLQYVSGVNPTIYWMSTACWDFTNYLIPCILCIIIFIAFQAESYVSGANLPCLCLLLLMYGISVTPLMYPACYIFTIPSTAYVLLTGLNAFIGINATTATYILDFFPDDQTLTDVNTILKKVFLICPQYCLGRGLFEMALNQIFADELGQYGDYAFRSPLNFDIAGKHILAMVIQSVVLFTVVLFIEHAYVSRRLIVHKFTKNRAQSSYMLNDDNLDVSENFEEDVLNETRKVLQGQSDDDPVVVKKLRKVYRTNFSNKLVAVKDLSFSVPKGQCFGLLGVNGAGKTSTFDILTGDSLPSKGQARIGGFDIVTDLINARKKVGFCPQFDALDPLLTVKEHVALYARLRGIPTSNVEAVAVMCIEKMGLKKYIHKESGTLSGGNKRKLSTAIALVGDPQIIFLDEPTSGMDPKARRYLWQCIHDAVSEGRSVVLTSHSMEECEALCTRLAIMVNGQFKCLGSTQHIKTKYGDGYVIMIKVPNGLVQDVEKFFVANFPTAEVADRLPTLMVFQLPQKDANLSEMFRILEHGKRSVFVASSSLEKSISLIEDYSVSQTTLDQVFINFASEQSEEASDKRKDKQSKFSITRTAVNGFESLLDTKQYNIYPTYSATSVVTNLEPDNSNPPPSHVVVNKILENTSSPPRLNDSFDEQQMLLIDEVHPQAELVNAAMTPLGSSSSANGRLTDNEHSSSPSGSTELPLIEVGKKKLDFSHTTDDSIVGSHSEVLVNENSDYKSEIPADLFGQIENVEETSLDVDDYSKGDKLKEDSNHKENDKRGGEKETDEGVVTLPMVAIPTNNNNNENSDSNNTATIETSNFSDEHEAVEVN